MPPLEQVPADFQVYFQAVERWRAGLSPYDASRMMTYKYSPGLLGAFIALFAGAVTAGEAWLRFKALSLLVWAGTLATIWPRRNVRDLLWLALGLLWSWKGLLEALDFGQLEIIGIAPLLLGFHWSTRRPLLAWACAACLPFLKLPWLVASLGMALAARRSWRTGWAVSAAVLALAGALVPWVVFGGGAGQAYADWVQVLGLQSSEILVTEPANQSLSAVSGRLLGQAWLGLALAGALGAWQLWRYRHGGHGPVLYASGLSWLALLCLASPLSWRWASLWFVELPLGLAQQWHRRKVRILAAVLAASWLLTQNPVVQALGLQHWTELHRAGWISAQWLLVFFAAG